jgi:8-oxo-dGTP diphosphatase
MVKIDPSGITATRMNRSVINVAAAVIEREGKILIGQRKRGDTHGLRWEFPGGKIERGESPAEALARELREELGIHAIVGSEIIRYEHRYPRRTSILLIFYRVTEFQGEPRSLAFEEIVWESVTRLPAYDFLDGDIDFVRRLAAGEF